MYIYGIKCVFVIRGTDSFRHTVLTSCSNPEKRREAAQS